MRKQITLTPTNEDVISRFSRYLELSQSAIINYAIFLFCCTFNDLPEREFKERVYDFYMNYYIKQLPRGKKAEEEKNASQKNARS